MVLVQQKGFITLIFIASLIWTAALDRPDGHYHFWVLGSRSDLSLIVKSREGSVAVVNPLPSADFLEKLGRRLPFYQRDLDLVVLEDASPASSKSLAALEQRYQVHQVWLPKVYQNISKDYKVIQLSGWESRQWRGLTWSTWSIPDFEVVNRVESGPRSLLWAGSSKEQFWQAVPDKKPVEQLIGPPVGKSGWLGQDIVEIFHPQLVVTNQQVKSSTPVKSAKELEIVWREGSWYIGEDR
jgi:hypothetical protein